MMPCFLVWYSNYSSKTGIEWCIKSKSVKLKTSSKFFEIRLINLFEMIIPPKIVFWFFATSYYWDYYTMGWYSFWRSSVFNNFFNFCAIVVKNFQIYLWYNNEQWIKTRMITNKIFHPIVIFQVFCSNCRWWYFTKVMN